MIELIQVGHPNTSFIVDHKILVLALIFQRFLFFNLLSTLFHHKHKQIITHECLIEGLVLKFNYENGKGGIYSYINPRLRRNL